MFGKRLFTVTSDTESNSLTNEFWSTPSFSFTLTNLIAIMPPT